MSLLYILPKSRLATLSFITVFFPFYNNYIATGIIFFPHDIVQNTARSTSFFSPSCTGYEYLKLSIFFIEKNSNDRKI